MESNIEQELRAKAIRVIADLFPADSEYPRTAEIGRNLLQQAQEEVKQDWRNLPLGVLLRYADLCREEEFNQSRS